MKKPALGWFKLLSQQEGEFYNVPIIMEGEELEALTKKLEVTRVGLVCGFVP